MEDTAAEAQAPQAEPEAAEPTPEPTAVDRSWSAIKAREKSFLQERNDFAQEKQIMQQLKAELETAKSEASRYKGDFKSDPLKFLEDNGMDFEDLSRRVLNNGEASPQEMIRRESTTHRTELENTRKELAEIKQQLQDQGNQRMVREYRDKIGSVLKKDEYEFLRSYPDAADLVFGMASRYAENHNEVLTADDAAARIQEELTDQLKALAKSPAIQRILGLAGTDKEQPAHSQTSTPSVSSGQTLKNSMAAAPPSEPEERPAATEYEALQRIAARLRASKSS